MLYFFLARHTQRDVRECLQSAGVDALATARARAIRAGIQSLQRGVYLMEQIGGIPRHRLIALGVGHWSGVVCLIALHAAGIRQRINWRHRLITLRSLEDVALKLRSKISETLTRLCFVILLHGGPRQLGACRDAIRTDTASATAPGFYFTPPTSRKSGAPSGSSACSCGGATVCG